MTQLLNPGQPARGMVLGLLGLALSGQAPPRPAPPVNLTVSSVAPPAIPTGWNDPRFAAVVARSPFNVTSGTFQDFEIISGDGNFMIGVESFTARRFRLRGREGVRVGGGDVLLEDFYLEITGVGADHADGIQHYIGSPGTTLRDRNGNGGYQLIARRGVIHMMGGPSTAGLFSADGSMGRIWLEDVKFIGAVRGLRVAIDGGGPVSCVRCVFENQPWVDVPTDVWEDNRMLDGTPVPRP